MLRDFVDNRKEGLLFRSSTGAQLLQSNTLSDSLHPTLKAIEHVKGGFNMFRRFRITHLQKTECLEVLRHFWSGHARDTCPSAARDSRKNEISGWSEQRRLGSGLSYQPQLGNLGNCASFRKSPKLLKRWWTRGDSNPRPPRCERGALPAELLAHEQQRNFNRGRWGCQLSWRGFCA
jgi:hypothetical protein